MGIRIVIVDDQELFREGLARLLDAEPDIAVVAITGHERGIPIVRRQQPDVVILGSAGHPGEHLEDLVRIDPRIKIVVLASQDDARKVKSVLSSGARGFMLKSAKADELLTTIRVLSRHEDRVVLSVSQSTVNRLSLDEETSLSDRELEVLSFVAKGLRNSEIALKLYIAEGTVKRHLTNIYAKLGASSRTDAVHKASKHGLTFG